jgi:hypothetical protein
VSDPDGLRKVLVADPPLGKHSEALARLAQ